MFQITVNYVSLELVPADILAFIVVLLWACDDFTDCRVRILDFGLAFIVSHEPKKSENFSSVGPTGSVL